MHLDSTTKTGGKDAAVTGTLEACRYVATAILAASERGFPAARPKACWWYCQVAPEALVAVASWLKWTAVAGILGV